MISYVYLSSTTSYILPLFFQILKGCPNFNVNNLQLKSTRKSPEGSFISAIYRRKSKTIQVVSDAEEQSTTEVTVIIEDEKCTSAETKPISPSRPAKDDYLQNLHQQDVGGMKNVQKYIDSDHSDAVPTGSSDYPSKKQKKLMLSKIPEVDSRTADISSPGPLKNTSEFGSLQHALNEENKVKHGINEVPHNSVGHVIMGDGTEVEGTSLLQLVQVKPNSSEWRPIEKELYLKGIEIFGRNRYHRKVFSILS